MVLLANSTLFLRGLRMNSNQMQGSYRRRQSLRVIRHAWFRHLLIQGCLAAGSIGLGVIFQGNCDAQDSFRSAPPKAWRQAGPWRAIGIGPAKETASNIPDQGLVQKASAEELARGSEKPAGVVNAIATTESRQPSLVRVPSISIEPPKPLQAEQSSSDQTATEISTSRSVGAKVKLSASVISEGSSSNEPGKSSTTNSSNLRVTRSGDITAETPVKVNFNQERIIALPALPSPASPYAETGIEIPVRVESLAETVQSIIETQTPMADLPAVPIHSVSEVQIQLERPPMLESLSGKMILSCWPIRSVEHLCLSGNSGFAESVSLMGNLRLWHPCQMAKRFLRRRPYRHRIQRRSLFARRHLPIETRRWPEMEWSCMLRSSECSPQGLCGLVRPRMLRLASTIDRSMQHQSSCSAVIQPYRMSIRCTRGFIEATRRSWRCIAIAKKIPCEVSIPRT